MCPSPSEWPVFLIIHGHFYQPPRENPWINRIERQDSAGPAHDWNERITSECYRANCFSRRLDGFGRIDEVVNNFGYLSYNVGPTLMAYLQRFHPDVHRRMVEADGVSARRYGGHGNAMAQVYNHVIMPLADGHDQETQMAWGLADFEHRFGRKAKGMWLAETAINDAVVDKLIEWGVEWTILSPHQAEAVRRIEEPEEPKAVEPKAPPSPGTAGAAAETKAESAPPANQGPAEGTTNEKAKGKGKAAPAAPPPWHDVSDGSIPTGRAYRIVRPGGRHLDVFFYDSHLSRAVSFEGLLRDADVFASKLYGSIRDIPEPQVVVVATDGETFGHHHPFGDMCIAALMRGAGPSHGLTLTNPGQYLERVPRRYEVRLKAGHRNEGTAWSCSHGVGRWYRNCGCSTGGPSDWQQAWRTPLREGLDHLKDELRRVFLRHTKEWFRDPWDARNDWIRVILADYAPEARDAFFERNLLKDADEMTRSDLCALLEAQKYAMYMFTSCAWFFCEISGIETVQNLKYAARAIELTSHFSPLNFEEILVCHLRRAPSNVPQWRDGGTVYKKLVKPYAGEDRQIAFNLLVEELFLATKADRTRYLDTVRLEDHRRVHLTGPERSLTLDDGFGRRFTEAEVGRFAMTNRVTDRHRVFDYLALKGPHLELEVYLNQSDETTPGVDLEEFAGQLFDGGGIESVRRQLVEYFKAEPFGATDIFFDLRDELVGFAIRDVTAELGATAEQALDRYGAMARTLLDGPAPDHPPPLGGEAPQIRLLLGGTTVATTPLLPLSDLISNDFVPVEILFDADGSFSLTYNGKEHFSKLYFPGYVPLAGARIGLGARTGGLNANHFIDDLSIETYTEPKPGIVLAPQDMMVVAGSAATFGVVLNNGETATVQWLRDDVAIPGAGGTSYTLAPVAMADSGAKFSARVTLGATVVTTTPATLTVVEIDLPATPVVSYDFDDGAVPAEALTYGAGLSWDGSIPACSSLKSIVPPWRSHT